MCKEISPTPQQHTVHKSVSRSSLKGIVPVPENRYSSSVSMIFPFCKYIEPINVFRAVSFIPAYLKIQQFV